MEGNYQNYPTKILENKNNKTRKQTEIFIDLGLSIPVSVLDLTFKNNIDYYRYATIHYVTDSFKTDKGWQYS